MLFRSGDDNLSNYYFSYSSNGWDVDGKDIRTFAETVIGEDDTKATLAEGRYAPLGVGDPCSYYLGSKWRMPTSAELNSLGETAEWTLKTNTPAWSATNWGAVTKTSHPSLIFPASGNRNNSTGVSGNVGTRGYYWSSSVFSATNGYYLLFDSSNVYPQYNHICTYGYTVRCVSE